MRVNLLLKLVVLGGLLFAFMIALIAIYGVVRDRARYRDQVGNDVARSTAGRQVVMGPVLVVHFRERITTEDAKGARTTSVETGSTVLLPESLVVTARAGVEERARGIHRAQVFRATQTLAGEFVIPPALGLPETRDLVDVVSARLVATVSDPRGLRRAPTARWAGAPVEVTPGGGDTPIERAIGSDVPVAIATTSTRVPFEVALELVGTERLAFVPVGGTTATTLESDWPHPSFDGAFLPDDRAVNAQGFRASWQLSRFATGAGVGAGQLLLQNPGGLEGRDFGVRFVKPVDIYQQAERAVKYGILFVLLTFVTFMMFEVLKSLAVHPVQYALAGAAVALFFLLLVSLSEHVPFALAYVIASAGCVGLLAFYVGHVLHSPRRGAGFAALLALLYALLYVLLQSEDYALLMGALLLFGVLATVMVITRRVDWYRVGAGAEAREP
jgi:inner membrane protein